MNNLNVFNVDNEQQELYFLLELDGGVQVQFNDPGLILTSPTITFIYSIFIIITILIITIINLFIFITFIFNISFIIFIILIIILTIIIIVISKLILTNIYNFSCIQIFIRNYNTFISIIFK